MKKLFVKILAATGLSIVGIGAAHAGLVVGTWDPMFGAPFRVADGYSIDLGWRGKAFFDVPNGCIPGGGGFQVVDAVACGATTQSAYVQLYDVNAVGQPTLQQLNWGGASPYAVGTLFDLLYNNGMLAGFNTGFFGSQLSMFNVTVPFFGAGTAYFGLDLTFGTNNPTTAYNGPQLSWTWNDCGDCAGGSNNQQIPINFQITAVPEPASIALAAIALIGAAAVRRRPASVPSQA